MNTQKIKKYAKIFGLFVLNCFSMFFSSEEERNRIVEYTRKATAVAA